jgi:branched-chain amino acid transport system permease protein
MTGSLQAHYIKFVGPDAYSGFQSLNLVVMNVIGGMTSLAGALIGTVFMVTLPELLRGYVNLQQIMFGAILFATMAFLPGGIVEVGRRVRALLGGRRPGAEVPGRASVPASASAGAKT